MDRIGLYQLLKTGAEQLLEVLERIKIYVLNGCSSMRRWLAGFRKKSNRGDITALHGSIDKVEERLLESEVAWQRSRIRWCQTGPDTHLTWRREVTGDNFISRVSSYNVFSNERTILEIGPGYGRLLKTCLQQQIRFKSYVGVDISPQNVKYLRENFPSAAVHFVHGDIENVSFDARFDVVVSSLTFKHLFPSFEKVLRNVANYVNPGGMVFFDLVEGNGSSWENDGVTYIRYYTRPEILEILGNVSLELVAFDQVRHDPDHPRLFVVARKPSSLRS